MHEVQSGHRVLSMLLVRGLSVLLGGCEITHHYGLERRFERDRYRPWATTGLWAAQPFD